MRYASEYDKIRHFLHDCKERRQFSLLYIVCTHAGIRLGPRLFVYFTAPKLHPKMEFVTF